MDNDLLETAACLWEAALECKAVPISKVAAAFFKNGTAEVRTAVVSGAAAANAAWETSEENANGEPFDWEFIPRWFAENFDWETISYG